MRLRRLLATIAFLVSIPIVGENAVNEAQGGGPVAIEISGDQLVSMKTDQASLAEIISELCAKTNVELRGFKAADRPVAATYANVPLRDVLQRLLREETYMIGVRASKDSTRLEVSWLHVTASKNAGQTTSPVPVQASVNPNSMVVPPSLSKTGLPAETVVDAMSSEDEAKRSQATQLLAEQFEKDPTSLGSFLELNVAATVDELAAYEYSSEALQTVALRQQDPVNRAKLDGLVQSLRLRTGKPAGWKKPTFAELMQQGKTH